MSFPYIGSNTGLFTRLGHIGFLFNSINTFVGTANLSAGGIESVGNGIDEIFGSFSSPDNNLISGLYSARDSYRGVHTSMLQYLQSLSQALVIQMMNDYLPLPQQNLTTAMTALIAQMTTDAQTVNKPTVSGSSTANGSNTGQGVLTVSVLNGSGLQKDYILNETIKAACTADSQSGATAGQETFTFTSPAAENNPLLWDYPLGSGISLTQNAVDALLDNSAGNLLQNGSFKQWTNPTIGPDNWLILVPGTGGVGTDIIQTSGSNVYKGNTGIAFVGDGSSLPSISQPFGATLSTSGNSGGTTATLKPLTPYAFNLYLKVNSIPAAGALAVELTDGNNNVLNNAQGVANSTTITLTGATTSFVAHNVFFQTPAVLPSSGVRLRIRLSTALSSGSTVYFGHAALMSAVQLYAGGPYIGLFSGNPNFYIPDYFTLTVSNNYASKFQLLADRIFGMRSLNLQLPSSTSPTIGDSLIA